MIVKRTWGEACWYGISLGCSFGQPTKKCSSDICDSSVFPNAICYHDDCTDCSLRYFIEDNEVTNACGKFLFFLKLTSINI